MILKLAVFAALAAPGFAGEYAVLWTGFRIRADRHETEGATVRLYRDGGTTELPASQIVRFDAEEEPAVPPRAPVTQPPSAEELVAAAAKRNGLPPEFVKSVAAIESGFRTNVVSPKGAVGLMQLMPSTARAYGADPADARQNVEAGTKYLRDLLLKYQHDDHQVIRALAAYNAGPGAVDRYHGAPPYRETLSYIGRVLRRYEKSPKPSAE
jgi:soluble lytic murein transglycosylase-like protein